MIVTLKSEIVMSYICIYKPINTHSQDGSKTMNRFLMQIVFLIFMLIQTL